MEENFVSICVVTHNNESKILDLMKSIFENTRDINFEVFLVDNASKDATTGLVKKNYPKVKIIKLKENKGFSYANNQILNKLNSKYHVVINPDIIFESNVFKELADYLEQNEDVAIITPKVLSEDGSVQYLAKKEPRLKYLLAGRLKNFFKFLGKYHYEYVLKEKTDKEKEPFEIENCTGCFMMIRSEVFKKLKGFDQRFFMYFEDVDLSKRARKYGKIIFYPKTHVIHLWERASAKNLRFLFIHISSMIKYFSKWKKLNA